MYLRIRESRAIKQLSIMDIAVAANMASAFTDKKEDSQASGMARSQLIRKHKAVRRKQALGLYGLVDSVIHTEGVDTSPTEIGAAPSKAGALSHNQQFL